MSNWWDTSKQGNAGKGLQPGLLSRARLRRVSDLRELRPPRQTEFSLCPDFPLPEFGDPKNHESGYVSYKLSYAVSAPNAEYSLKYISPATPPTDPLPKY